MPPSRAPRRSRPGRTLAVLGLLLVTLFGSLAAGVRWGDADWQPGLALDLEGGTQIILTPRSTNGAEVTPENLERAVAIISRRVDSRGVSEAQVQVVGGRNISVSIPGTPSRETLELVRQSAQLRFRPVLVAADGAPTPMLDPQQDPAAQDPAAPPAPAPSPTQSGEGAVVPQALLAQPAPEATAPEAPALEATAPAPDAAVAGPPVQGPAQPTDTPSPQPTDNSDPAWLTPDVERIFAGLDCARAARETAAFDDDPTKVLVTCSQDGTSKFVLGPADLQGTDVAEASSAQAQNDQGFPTGGWEVRLQFTGEGGEEFRQTTARLSTLEPPRNRFGIVLDGLVIVAPSVSQPIPGGSASIEGDFTQEETETLASQLRFGALPLSFDVQTEDQISPTLGADQLERGLLAGAIGLGLVVLYSLLQYRALGLVTVGSLTVAGLITYAVITLLSWLQDYRLSLAGVAGLIVAIGITADSFIVFFERVRDEIRDGRTLHSAVGAGWHRARRTILISGSVSLLAAVVLYVLAVGNVAGFAFTLGVTTIVDVVVVFLFTHPVVALLARTRFFGGGHRLSGFDPVHLGSVVARHALRSGAPRETVAARRAAARAGTSSTSTEGEGNA